MSQNPAAAPSESAVPIPEKPVTSPMVVKSDLVTAIALIVCAALACLPDRARQSALCRSIARKHIGLRGSRAATLQTLIPLLDSPVTAEILETLLLADEYEAVAETWREYLPWTSKLTGNLRGQDHMDAALANGRGAVLWHCSAGPGSRVALRCLAEAGYKPVALRRHDYPFSGSRFSRTAMNPISSRRDDRYLESVVILREDREEAAMAALRDHLAANKLVLVAAGATFGSPRQIPYFGGTLSLGTGAPTLAMGQGAPLIPLFCLADGEGGYDVIAEQPLMAGPETDGEQTVGRLVEHFATVLAPYLKHKPRLWDCWYAEDTWKPATQGANSLSD